MAPIDPEHAIDQAIARRERGDITGAAQGLTRALDRHPRNPRLWQTLGTVHRTGGDLAAAADAFARAAALAPADPRAAYGVAQAELEAGRPAAALFGRARALAPGDGGLVLGQVAALLAEGQGDAALALLDAATANSPGWYDGLVTLARLRWSSGDRAGYAAGFTRARDARPRDAGLWGAWLNLLLQNEAYAEADAVLAQARQQVGDPALFPAIAATVASELGKDAAADAAFALLATDTDAAVVERHMRHLLRTGRPDAAAARGAPLLDGSQQNAIWPYMALAWRLTGDPRRAWLEGDPALVSVQDLDGVDLEALAGVLLGLHLARHGPLGQSVRGGTQTDGPLFARVEPEIRGLRAAIVAAIERHVAGMGKRDPDHPVRRHIGKPFRFAGSWSVRLTGAGHHSNHIHAQGWLSSAFYVSLPPQPDMGPPPAGWFSLGEPPAELALPLAAERHVEPRPGRLVLFPSIMWHGTVPIERGERLTVAFDVAPFAGA